MVFFGFVLFSFLFSDLMRACFLICDLDSLEMISDGLECDVSGCFYVTHFPAGSVMSVLMLIIESKDKR